MRRLIEELCSLYVERPTLRAWKRQLLLTTLTGSEANDLMSAAHHFRQLTPHLRFLDPVLIDTLIARLARQTGQSTVVAAITPENMRLFVAWSTGRATPNVWHIADATAANHPNQEQERPWTAAEEPDKGEVKRPWTAEEEPDESKVNWNFVPKLLLWTFLGSLALSMVLERVKYDSAAKTIKPGAAPSTRHQNAPANSLAEEVAAAKCEATRFRLALHLDREGKMWIARLPPDWETLRPAIADPASAADLTPADWHFLEAYLQGYLNNLTMHGNLHTPAVDRSRYEALRDKLVDKHRRREAGRRLE